MIRIEDLVKEYGTHRVLDRISVQMTPGEVVGIIGPSGGGKSTLLRMINRLEVPTSGTIAIDEIVLTEKTVAVARKRIGMVFQLFNLFPHMTVLQNITYGPVRVQKWPKTEAEARARELLQQVGLSGKADAYPGSLSGGQKQRVAIARALAASPEIILFDEPTSALDPENVKEVVQVIREVAKGGITCLLVTHEMALARDVAKRILFLDHGALIEDQPSDRFFQHPQTERAKQFLEQLYA